MGTIQEILKEELPSWFMMNSTSRADRARKKPKVMVSSRKLKATQRQIRWIRRNTAKSVVLENNALRIGHVFLWVFASGVIFTAFSSLMVCSFVLYVML